MLQDRDHDASTIIVTLCQHHNYHYFYALGNVIIIILRDKVLMAYWQLILFPVASYCTSALELWIWLSVADRNLHYKYYQPFSFLHHSNIKYFSIGQQSWVAQLRQAGICTFLMLDLEFFSLYVGVTTVLLCDWTSLLFQNIKNIGANFPLLKLVFLHYLIWWWGFDITILH